MTLAIEAEDLRKTYPPAVTALDGVSVAVEAGTIFGLLGPNGAGKSTTVRVLSTLTRPDSGRAEVGGIDVLADPVGVRRAIGVVGQKHGADPEATGRENLVLQGEFYGLTGRELKQRVAHSLERFGLTDAAGRQVRTYSGGMQRRLEIAMGLAAPPAGAVPRRADDGPRSGGAGADVARDRAARCRGADDDPADHALPRGGRSPRLDARDHRSRQGRGAGNAQRAQERASRRRHPGRARRRRRLQGERRAWAASPVSARSRSTAA